MCRVFRRVLVLALAFALVASGTAWRQCTSLQLAAAASIGHGSHLLSHHAQTASHGEHDRQTMHQHVADDSTTPATPADDHGCLKCCAMCTVANALAPAVTGVAIFTVSSAVFFRAHEDWSGSTVAVDPGIPKHIV